MKESFHRSARERAMMHIESIQHDLAPSLYRMYVLTARESAQCRRLFYAMRDDLNDIWDRWAHDPAIRREIQRTHPEIRNRLMEIDAHIAALKIREQRKQQREEQEQQRQQYAKRQALTAESALPLRENPHMRPVRRAAPPSLATTYRSPGAIASEPLPPARRLSWKILGEHGIHSFKDVLHFVETQQREAKEHTYDIARLHKTYSLHPSSIYSGRDEFDGYVVFVFKDQQIALLECPVVGNALYALRGSWQILARKSKAELLDDPTDAVTRIIHVGNWFARVQHLVHLNDGVAAEHTSGGGRRHAS